MAVVKFESCGTQRDSGSNSKAALNEPPCFRLDRCSSASKRLTCTVSYGNFGAGVLGCKWSLKEAVREM